MTARILCAMAVALLLATAPGASATAAVTTNVCSSTSTGDLEGR